MISDEIGDSELSIVLSFLKYVFKPYSIFLKLGFWLFHKDIVLIKKILDMSCHKSLSELSRIVNLFADQLYTSSNRIYQFVRFKNPEIIENYISIVEKTDDPWYIYAPMIILTNLLKTHVNLPLNVIHIVESIYNINSTLETSLYHQVFEKDIWFPGYTIYPSNIIALKENKKTLLKQSLIIYNELGKIIGDNKLWNDFIERVSEQVKNNIADLGRRLLNREVNVLFNFTDLKNIDLSKVTIYNNKSKSIMKLSIFISKSLPLYGGSGLENEWKRTRYYQRYLKHRYDFIKNSSIFKILFALKIIEKRISPELIYYVDLESPSRIVIIWPKERSVLIDRCLNMDIETESSRVMNDLYKISRCILLSLL